MGRFLMIVGGFVAAVGLFSAFTAWPQGAVQQAVQGLWLIAGVLGLIILGIGKVVSVLLQIREQSQSSARQGS